MLKVIWFDDQEKSLEGIREEAHLHDIELIGFEDAESGIQELKSNIIQYDAAIVDGKFWLKKGNEVDEVGDRALLEVAMTFERLSGIKKLPWFVLSGQSTFTRQKNTIVEGFKNGRVYDKLNSDDLVSLWEDIKNEVNVQEETQIRHQYATVFEIFDNGFLTPQDSRPLVDILMSFRQPTEKFNDDLYFTKIRIILESVFRFANRFGLLHDKCINDRGNVNLSESSLFLSGSPTKRLGVMCSKSHFDRITSEAVWSIIAITGAASHTSDDRNPDNYNLELYRRHINTPYLLYSLAFRLMDVLVWFKNYVEENNNIELNRSYWSLTEETTPTGDWIRGEVFNMKTEKGFAFFKPEKGGNGVFIPPAIVSSHKLADQMIVSAIIEEYKNNKTGEMQSRVKEIKLETK